MRKKLFIPKKFIKIKYFAFHTLNAKRFSLKLKKSNILKIRIIKVQILGSEKLFCGLGCRMIGPVQKNDIVRWRGNNICGLSYDSKYSDFEFANVYEHLKSQKVEVNDIPEVEGVRQYTESQLDGVCSSGKKACGRISDPDIFLCFDESIPCPINSLVIDFNAAPPDASYVSLFFGDGAYLHYSKEKRLNFLVSGDFRIGKGKVCMHPAEQIGSVNPHSKKGKLLDECSSKIGGRKEDEIMVKVGESTRKEILNSNYLGSIFENNQLYRALLESEGDGLVDIFNKPYIYIKDKCVDEGDLKENMINGLQWRNFDFDRVSVALLISSVLGLYFLF